VDPTLELPPWNAAAVVVEAFANAAGDDAFLGLDPALRARSLAALQALRTGDREARAQALAQARRGLPGGAPRPEAAQEGLRFLARWLKALSAPERAQAVGAIDGETARGLRPYALRETALAAGQVPAALWLVATLLRLRGRPVDAPAVGAALAALRGAGATDRTGSRVERAARASGRGNVLGALAMEILG
jgi:hypothetical protein